MILYRPMQEEDLDAVMQIERACFTDYWSREDMLRELRKPAQQAGYYVAEDDGHVIGYAGFWQVLDEAQITNVAVRADYRGQGIGLQLLQTLEQGFHKRGVSIVTLECRAGNTPALRLYQKAGFQEAGVRKRYYENPTEDAVIFTKQIAADVRSQTGNV